MPHVQETLEDRIHVIATHCEDEEHVLTFGFDPQATCWFSRIEDMRSGAEIMEFTDDTFEGAVCAMEAYLEL